jgi:hypothetical protein
MSGTGIQNQAKQSALEGVIKIDHNRFLMNQG